MNKELLIELLQREVLPTTGCTEPGAVALAVAYASEALTGSVDTIAVTVNSNIYKNGVAVGIPGTGETGLEIAAALGAIKQQPANQLSVLAEVTPHQLQQAQAMLAAHKVVITVDEEQQDLWIGAKVKGEAGWSRAVIADRHTNLVLIEKNGQAVYQSDAAVVTGDQDTRHVLRGSDVTIAGMIALAETMTIDELGFLLDGVDMNVHAAQLGIGKKLGMGIGAIFTEMIDAGLVSDDIVNSAKIMTAGAADARMSGENVQVMSSAGSGNHGITAILPVYAVGRKLGVERERLAQAIAISHLITVYIKIHTGSLSALCGCAVAAATGATAAITWLMGGTSQAIGAAIKNVIANLTGMICDGGKVGCALKLSTAAATAVESSLLAQRNIVVPDTNGIIGNTVEETIKNLGRISNPGMLHTDKVITDVMLAKSENRQALS